MTTRNLLLVSFLFSAAVAAVPRVSSAQESVEDAAPEDLLSDPKPRQGYYLALSGAGGVAGFNHYEEGWLPVFGGGGGGIHTGQTLNDRLGIGLEISFLGGGNEDRNLLMGRIALELRVNLWDNWFARPSIGFGFTDFYRRHENVKQILGTIAAAYTLSAGYDFVINTKKYGSGGYTLSPILWVSGANGINLHSISGGIGIEIARWGGLDKNQLRLPVEKAF